MISIHLFRFCETPGRQIYISSMSTFRSDASHEYFERFNGLEGVVITEEIAAYTSEETIKNLSFAVLINLADYIVQTRLSPKR